MATLWDELHPILMKLHRNNNWKFSSLWNMDILKLLLVLTCFRSICLYFLNRFPAASPPNDYILERVYVHAWINVHIWITHYQTLASLELSKFKLRIKSDTHWHLDKHIKHMFCVNTQFGFNFAYVSFYKFPPMDQLPGTWNKTAKQWYFFVCFQNTMFL